MLQKCRQFDLFLSSGSWKDIPKLPGLSAVCAVVQCLFLPKILGLPKNSPLNVQFAESVGQVGFGACILSTFDRMVLTLLTVARLKEPP
jgi:hypothetical protein